MKGIKHIQHGLQKEDPLLPASRAKVTGQQQETVSTRRTRLIRPDIQISSAAAFSKGSDLLREQTGVLNIACLTTHVYRKAEVASGRIARLCDDQTSLAEKWKPKSGYHSHFLDSRGANSLPITHKLPIPIPPLILFYTEARNPTWRGFGRCQKPVIIIKKSKEKTEVWGEEQGYGS